LTTTTTPNSGPRTAKLALLVPLAVLGAMVTFVGLIATLLLFNTKNGSLALAAVAAGGILFTVSLLASSDSLERGQKFAAVGAGIVPLVLGGLVAGGVIGGVDDADRMVNVQPLLVVPDDAPLLGAQNSESFCALEEPGGSCEDTDSWEVTPSAEAETLSFFFENQEAGVPHNVVITELEGSADDPSAGELLVDSELITGPDDEYYEDEALTWDELPEEWYFYCEVHANMNGVGTLAAAG
jgi:hypothetical protein